MDYVQKSTEIKNPEALATYQIKQIESAIETYSKELTTKSDLLQLRYDMLKFIVWTGLGSVITLGGMIAHGFHWI